MKKIYSLIALSTLFITAQAQNFEWAKREGRYAYDYGFGITTDNAGNVYAAGKYEEENANFSGTLLPCQGNHDIWLAQYSSSGNLNWIRTAGGTSGDFALSVACDNSYVYIGGEIEGVNETIYFSGSSITLECLASNDIMVAKYDLSGNLIWAERAGGYEYEKAYGVTYDQSGNVYICGLYRGSVTFGGNTTIACTSDGVNDIFLAKYNSNGVFQWVRHAGGTGRDEAKSVKCDADGNIYICGLYSNDCDFGTTTLSTYNNTDYFDAFIAKYSPDGTLQWVKKAGSDYDDVAWSLTIDNAGKLYISGEFRAYCVFDDTHHMTATGRGDVFVACYNNAGTLEWVTKAGGALDDRARGIGCDGTNLYITGQFGNTASFGSATLTAADSSDIFIATLTNSGSFINAVSVDGPADAYEPLGYESGNAICADANGNAYATGALLDGGVFGTITYSPYSRTDAFITKITELTSVDVWENNKPEAISVYPNPGKGIFTIDLAPFSSQVTVTTISDYLGQIVATRTNKPSSKITIDLSASENGVYFVRIEAERQSTARGKIIIQ